MAEARAMLPPKLAAPESATLSPDGPGERASDTDPAGPSLAGSLAIGASEDETGPSEATVGASADDETGDGAVAVPDEVGAGDSSTGVDGALAGVGVVGAASGAAVGDWASPITATTARKRTTKATVRAIFDSMKGRR
jgi:hypothetical protein